MANDLGRIAKLRQRLAGDSEIAHRVHLGQCSMFLKFAIEHARDLAKSNAKDEARQWFKFIRNSRLLDILEHECVECDMAEMRNQLSLLGGECHPLDVPDLTNDLAAIRGHLEELLRRTGGVSHSPSLQVVERKA